MGGHLRRVAELLRDLIAQLIQVIDDLTTRVFFQSEPLSSQNLSETAWFRQLTPLVFATRSWHPLVMEINGIAHVILTVRDVARSHDFYRPLLTMFGMTCVMDTPVYVYYVGGRTALGLRPASDDEPFSQSRVGLHHLCFRARSREDVDAVHHALPAGTRVVHAPEQGPWVPGYYSVLFEDPDGIRLEVNFVPGKGVLDPNIQRARDAP